MVYAACCKAYINAHAPRGMARRAYGKVGLEIKCVQGRLRTAAPGDWAEINASVGCLLLSISLGGLTLWVGFVQRSAAAQGASVH